MVTDGDGRVAAFLQLGPDEGRANNVVQATFAGNPGAPATFPASGLVAGNPAQTSVTGVVLDNSNLPIPGVTMRLLGLSQGTNGNVPIEVVPPVQTNSQGQFVITQAPVGVFKLMADGTTATVAGKRYPTLEFDVTTVAGRSTTIGMPIYLQALDTVNQLCVSETTGGTLTLPAFPGFSLTVAPGSATFPGGSRSGCISATPVNPDKVPMAPGFGQQPRFILTIQPVGTTFNPPAPITIPNVDGLPPRAVTELYSYDHDLAAFVAIGTGTVSDDGMVLRSDPGVGVLKAGWHCGGDPAANGTVADCPACRWCQGGTCVTDPAQAGHTCPDDNSPNCTINKCQGGNCNREVVAPIAAYNPDPYPLDTGNLTAGTQTALACLQAAVGQAGGSFSVTSAFRPQSYQDHIREVWDKHPKLPDLTSPKCAATRQNIQAEWDRHGLAFQPAAHSNHSAGTAFDGSWDLPQGVSIDTLAGQCGLSRCVAGDHVHFCH